MLDETRAHEADLVSVRSGRFLITRVIGDYEDVDCAYELRFGSIYI